MIDVHILTLPNENKNWLADCQKSLNDEPVVVHLVPGIPGNLGESRYQGFNVGQLPFAACVDSDDIVEPGGFSVCYSVLKENPSIDVVYTAEYVVDCHATVKPNTVVQRGPHHIIVFRRIWLNKNYHYLKEWTHSTPMSELQFLLKKSVGSYYEIEKPYYRWRQHYNSCLHRQRRK